MYSSLAYTLKNLYNYLDRYYTQQDDYGVDALAPTAHQLFQKNAFEKMKGNLRKAILE